MRTNSRHARIHRPPRGIHCAAPMDILTETTPDIPIIQKPEIPIIQSCRSEIPIIPKLPVGNSDNSNYWSTSGITGRNYWRTSGELFPKLPGDPPKVAGCAFCPHQSQKPEIPKVAGALPKLPDRIFRQFKNRKFR